MKTICYLDMDDVLADFKTQAKKYIRFNCDTFKEKSREQMNAQERNRQNELFHYCDYDNSFWETMPVRPGAKDLYDFCLKNFDEVVLLTRYVPPVENKKRFEAVRFLKLKWAHQHLGTKNHLPRIIVCDRAKSLFIGTGKETKLQILVDDMQKNIADWVKNGGVGIVYQNNLQVRNVLKNIKSAGFGNTLLLLKMKKIQQNER